MEQEGAVTFDFTVIERRTLMLALSDSIERQRTALAAIDQSPARTIGTGEREQHLKNLVTLRNRLMAAKRPSRPRVKSPTAPLDLSMAFAPAENDSD